jgi:hypothetical protein
LAGTGLPWEGWFTLLGRWNLVFILTGFLFFVLDSMGTIHDVVELVPCGWKQVLRELALLNIMAIFCILTGDLGTREFVYFRF